jgi:DNA mismatch endonuclease (patch repair protein)
MPDFLTKEQRSSLMSKVRSKGTKIELIMKKALDDNGIKYIYQPIAFGKPDFLIPPKIAVFCDSSFWHGRNWRKLKNTLQKGYWQEHILANRRRDALVNRTLRKQGYVVLRFWDKDIQKNLDKCINSIRHSVSHC